jgi:Protein of unknown function (DUF1214)
LTEPRSADILSTPNPYLYVRMSRISIAIVVGRESTMRSALMGLLLLLGVSTAALPAIAAKPDRPTADAALSAAWTNYYKTLEDIRAQVESTARFRNNVQHRAKAYHVLMEIQALSFNLVIAPRMSHPRLHRALMYQTDIYATGLPGPDFVYATALLDGAQTYRMRGRLPQSKFFVIQTWNVMYGEPGFKNNGNYDLGKMAIAPDGTFELLIGGAQPTSGNWIPLDASSAFQPLVVRKLMTNWANDVGELSLERISAIDDDHYDRDEFDPAAQAARIRRATDYIRFLGDSYILGLYDITLSSCNNRKNVICLWTAEGKAKTGGSGLANYIAGIFALADDEALLIEMPGQPDAAYWSFQIGDVWGRSLPFQDRRVGLNMKQASIDTDGVVRVVLSRRDPGVVNWLDTAGRQEGIVLYRNYLAGAPVIPTARKVKFADLSSVLPKDSPRIDAAQRKAELDTHRRNVLHVMDE